MKALILILLAMLIAGLVHNMSQPIEIVDPFKEAQQHGLTPYDGPFDPLTPSTQQPEATNPFAKYAQQTPQKAASDVPVQIVDPFKEAEVEAGPWVHYQSLKATQNSNSGQPFMPAPGEIERVNAAIRADYEQRQAMLESIRQSRRDEEPAYTWQQHEPYVEQVEQAAPTYAAPVYPRTYAAPHEGSQPTHVYNAAPQDPPRIRAIDNGYGTTFRDQNGVRYRAEAIPGTSNIRLNDANGQQAAKCVDAGFGNLRCR